ncbi:UPF0721 transmembrane protein [Aliidongia dinghuensis]|uniref:Probable membrane transporter protein n=1 Tax=Aliidongia dinghuensis TaxID=1867774 RepID=A0A8J2YZZ3_9PROT|nr:sulfite exporter TauE/SafE family protein [Aliidongia dinghuensis]GGF48184.1 UPF0721 transmembrane protein [Aliidongia dinghuensis]
MITDPWFYALAIPALLITSISKGGFGAGLGVLAVPLIALRLPVAEVTPILLPIICLMDAASLWGYRGRWDGRILAITLPGALIGIALGAVGVGTLPDVWLRLAIGTIAVAFPLRRWLAAPRRQRTHEGPGGEGRFSGRRPAQGVFWSFLSGITSFLANAGGPPFSIYLMTLRLDKTLFVGTTAVFFAVVNFTKLVPFAWLGLFTRTSLITSAALSPVALVGIALGFWLHRRLDPALFYRISFALVFLLGVRFVWSSAATILGTAAAG